jgi:hypothetical protein
MKEVFMDREALHVAIDELLAHRTELVKAIRSQPLNSGYCVKVELDENGYWVDAKVIKQQNVREGDALYIECNPFKSRDSIADDIFEWEEKMSKRLLEVQEPDRSHDHDEMDTHDFYDDDFLGRGR